MAQQFQRPRGSMVIEVLLSLAMVVILVVVIGNTLGAVHRLERMSELKERALGYARQAMENVDATYYTQFRESPPSTCTPMSSYGYTTCWGSGDGEYSESCVQVSSTPALYRKVTVANNVGASRPNDVKQVTVQVFSSLTSCSASSQPVVSLTHILTAWKN